MADTVFQGSPNDEGSAGHEEELRRLQVSQNERLVILTRD